VTTPFSFQSQPSLGSNWTGFFRVSATTRLCLPREITSWTALLVLLQGCRCHCTKLGRPKNVMQDPAKMREGKRRRQTMKACCNSLQQ
jgi:hypothetical protein